MQGCQNKDQECGTEPYLKSVTTARWCAALPAQAQVKVEFLETVKQAGQLTCVLTKLYDYSYFEIDFGGWKNGRFGLM